MWEIESRVGLYINTLPLCSRLKEGERIEEWLRELQASQLSCRERQYSSLSSLQKWSGVVGEWFDSLLVYENYPLGRGGEKGGQGLRASGMQTREQTNYPLTLLVTETDRVNIRMSYNGDLLSREAVERIGGHLVHVLEQIVLG